MRKALIIAALAAYRIAHAGGDPALGKLEQALPAGWSLLATDTELVLRHDRPVYATGGSAGPLITVELRYRLEPVWTGKQLAEAKATNARVAAELKALRAKHRIDAIPRSKGDPQPRDADERARLAAFAHEETSVAARMVPLPLCTLGTHSVFDGKDTYAQLGLEVDPADAMREAYRVADLVKQQCGAS